MSAPTILVRGDGGAALGMGHVSRCLALAVELRDAHGINIVFAMGDAASAGVAAVRANGFVVAPIADPDKTDYGAPLLALASSLAARALVVDVRDALSRASLDAIHSAGIRVVTIDDGSDRRFASDLAFYPPVPQVEEMDWTGFAGQRFSGWEWVLLKREFQGPHEVSRATPPIDILVTMGGSDPAGMTEVVVAALDLLPQAMAVEVVIGPAFNRAAALAATVARSKHAVRVTQGPDAMAPLMRESRVAVASFGVSAYELAACGVPAVYLCLTPDHARSASAFDRERIALSLGLFGEIRPQQIADAVASLLDDTHQRAGMADRARRLVDGRGAQRIAALIGRF